MPELTKAFDATWIHRDLSVLSREPFKDLLEQWIGTKPSPASITAFAEKYPDRWAQGLTMLARLAGYREQIDVRPVGAIDARALDAMSDAELMALASKHGVLLSPEAQPPKAPAELVAGPSSAPDPAPKPLNKRAQA